MVSENAEDFKNTNGGPAPKNTTFWSEPVLCGERDVFRMGRCFLKHSGLAKEEVHSKPGSAVHAFNLSSQEAKADGPL